MRWPCTVAGSVYGFATPFAILARNRPDTTLRPTRRETPAPHQVRHSYQVALSLPGRLGLWLRGARTTQPVSPRCVAAQHAVICSSATAVTAVGPLSECYSGAASPRKVALRKE